MQGYCSFEVANKNSLPQNEECVTSRSWRNTLYASAHASKILLTSKYVAEGQFKAKRNKKIFVSSFHH